MPGTTDRPVTNMTADVLVLTPDQGTEWCYKLRMIRFGLGYMNWA